MKRMLAARGVRLPQPLFDATDAELLRYADDGGLLNVRLPAVVRGAGGLAQSCTCHCCDVCMWQMKLPLN